MKSVINKAQDVTGDIQSGSLKIGIFINIFVLASSAFSPMSQAQSSPCTSAVVGAVTGANPAAAAAAEACMAYTQAMAAQEAAAKTAASAPPAPQAVSAPAPAPVPVASVASAVTPQTSTASGGGSGTGIFVGNSPLAGTDSSGVIGSIDAPIASYGGISILTGDDDSADDGDDDGDDGYSGPGAPSMGFAANAALGQFYTLNSEYYGGSADSSLDSTTDTTNMINLQVANGIGGVTGGLIGGTTSIDGFNTTSFVGTADSLINTSNPFTDASNGTLNYNLTDGQTVDAAGLIQATTQILSGGGSPDQQAAVDVAAAISSTPVNTTSTTATATTTTDPTTTASASTTDTSAPPAAPVAQTGSVGGNSASTNYGGGLNFATGDSSNTPIADNAPLPDVTVTASLIGSSSSGNNSNDTSLTGSVAAAALSASANMAAGTGNVATYVPGGTIADANASFAADPPTDPSLADTLFRPAAPPVDPALGETIPRGLNTGLNDGIEPNWWINNTPSQADMLETIQNLPQFTWCATGQMCGSIATQVDNILKGGDGGVLLPQDGAYFSSTYSNMGLTVPTSNLTADQALAAMAASPDGSTFFVNMTPVGGGTGHVINGVNFAQESGTGITMFVDGQWGGQYASPNLGQFTQNNPDNYTYSIVDTSNARIDNPNLLAAENVSLYSNTANAYSAGGEQILNDFLGLAKPLAGTIADTSMALASGALDLAGGPVGVGLLANAALDPLYQNVGSLAQSGMSKNLQTLVSPNSSFGGNVDAASALLLDTTVAGLTAAGHEVNALPGQALSALDSAMSPQGLISQNVASMQAQLNQQYGAPTASFNAAVQMANANGYVIGPDGQTWITPASAAQQYPNQPIQEVTVTAQAPSMGTAVVANLQNIGSNIGGGISNAYTGAVGTVASLFCKMSSNCQ